MSSTTTYALTYTCDRCRATDVRTLRSGEAESRPKNWRRLRLISDSGTATECDICEACADSLKRWVAEP